MTYDDTARRVGCPRSLGAAPSSSRTSSPSSSAWRSIHQGADLRLPRVFKWIMTYVTPLYLLVLLSWWGISDALPILRLERAAGGGPVSPEAELYVLLSRAILLLFFAGLLLLVRAAWRRNGYDERRGLEEASEPTASFAPSAPAPAVDA
jgi:hypothetical protein